MSLLSMITRESTCCGCRQSMMNLNYLANCAPLAFQVGGNRDKKKASLLPQAPTPNGSRGWRRTYQFWHDVTVEPPPQHKHAVVCELLLVWTTATTKKGGQDIPLKVAAAWSWHMLASVGISHGHLSFTTIDPAVAAMMNEKLKLISEGYY